MIHIEASGIKISIPADTENAAGLVSAVIAQLSSTGKFEENETADGLISEKEAVRRERAAVEKARRKWKREAENHENHGNVTRDENVIQGKECLIECENELININKNINNIHSNKHSTMKAQTSVAKVVKPRKNTPREADDGGQYLLEFMYELPLEWKTEKVQQAWKVFVEEFTNFRLSSSRPKRQHTKSELLGILDLLRIAYSRKGEKGLLDTIWQAVESQRRYVWDLPNSCRNTQPKRPQTIQKTKPHEPETETLTPEEMITFQKEQVEFYRNLGMTELRKKAEEKLKEMEGK